MLSARNRMRRSGDFSDALRRGARGASSCVVVHLDVNLTDGEPAVGFVVSKAVGNSVVRHRVQRRLRHIMRDRLTDLPAGARVVVRALPSAADATSRTLGDDVDRALRTAIGRTRGVRAGVR